MEMGVILIFLVMVFVLVDDFVEVVDVVGGGECKSGWIYRVATNGIITGLEGNKKSGVCNNSEVIVVLMCEGGSLELFLLFSCMCIWCVDGLFEGMRVLSS